MSVLEPYAYLAYIARDPTGRGTPEMARSANVKRDRMHLRLDAKTKRKLERAAAYEDTNVTDFVLANAIAAAERVIDSHEKITLSARDWDVFYEALINPPEPNVKLKKAARRYRERVGG
jgi:uncharacterized protein (DUF1778 family)